jgi:Zn-finger nucleic acid-binding protein
MEYFAERSDTKGEGSMEGAAKAGMLCPVCRVNLMMSNREGVEIDYCPQCRGVWLDRGELDKIVERSLTQVPAAAPAPAAHRPPEPAYRDRGYPDDRYGRPRDDDHYRHRDHDKRKRRGWLGDLLDFD